MVLQRTCASSRALCLQEENGSCLVSISSEEGEIKVQEDISPGDSRDSDLVLMFHTQEPEEGPSW